MTAQIAMQPEAALVLGKAAFRASQQLGLSQTELASVLGIHRTAISRLKNNPHLEPDSKQGELALLLIRIARSLYALTGGDETWIQHFMRSRNMATHGIPAQQITSIQGLVGVLQIVDALRGKI
jgi:transcriptional regulator with XRE-family HTH domain